MASPRRQLPRVSVIWVLVTALLSITLGVSLACSLATADREDWGQWLRDFAKSPGAAAFAALVAAAIAFGGIQRQVAVSRDVLEHQRAAARADAWWARFEWASDRAIPRRNGEHALPVSVSVGTLERLAAEASDQVQEVACAGVMNVLTSSMKTVSFDDPGNETLAGGSSVAHLARAALESYVKSTAGTAAASATAEARVYELHLANALAAIAATDPRVKVFRNPPTAADNGADAIAEVEGRRVIIQIKVYQSPSMSSRSVADQVRYLRKRVRDTDAILVVSNVPVNLPSTWAPEMRVTTVVWRDSRDDAQLLAALLRASGLQ